MLSKLFWLPAHLWLLVEAYTTKLKEIEMRDGWLLPWNVLIRWPDHIRRHIWWAGQFGIYGKLSIGPCLPKNYRKMQEKGGSVHAPYDLRCNCCFCCGWLLRITIRPILDIFDWIVAHCIKLS